MKPIGLDEIENAAEILLDDKNGFYDDIDNTTGERIDVIKELGTKNIIASPGSGKTTALLAKLLILSNRMPFDDGRGICVLTHTNVAIDLIKEKIGNKSSKLFNYPNFFGTIQSFVDKFVAVGAAIKYYQKRPDRIDNDLAFKLILKNFNSVVEYKCPLHKSIYTEKFHADSKVSINEFQKAINIDKDAAITELNELANKGVLNRTQRKRGYAYKLDMIKSNWHNIKNDESISKEIKKYIFRKRESIKEDAQNEKIKLLQNLTLDFINQKVLKSNNDTFHLFKHDAGKKFVELKEGLFSEGILSYRDAFDVSSKYLNDYPLLSNIISERFKFVFIDEMQDTADYQNKIIERLFGNSKNTIVQYYGDPNQAIYDSFSDDEAGWNPDFNNALFIKQSKRFGTALAEIINPLQVAPNDKFPVEGNERVENLPKYIITYNDKNDASKVMDVFGELILEHKLNNEKSKFVALGRVGTKRDDDHITLANYFPHYEGKTNKKDEYFDDLISYLKKVPLNNNQIKLYSKKIINAILQFLYKQGLRNIVKSINNEGDIVEKERRFSKTTLFSYLKKENNEIYHELKLNIALWSRKIFVSEKQYSIELKEEIEYYLKNKLISVWGVSSKDDSFFTIPDDVDIKADVKDAIKNSYEYKFNNDKGEEDKLEISINTIHGEKGETHTATLYLETFFRKKYESTTFINHLCGEDYKGNGGKEMEQALKLAYVGMSRPSKLLCIAIWKENIEGSIDKLDIKKGANNKWIIKPID